MNRRARDLGGLLGGALLNLAALGGLISLALVALAFFFNITLTMFKTGSMGPTIPAGSLAVVRKIPAKEIRVGDIVTVDRPGMLPITHRVTSVAGGPTETERTITMKGDANDAGDPAPYTLSNARIVLVSAPGLAYGIVWLSNPWVLGTVALGSSALVTWAFWPRGPRIPELPGRREPPGRNGPLDLAKQIRPRNHTVLALIVVPLALSLGVPAPVSGVSEQVTKSRHLTLTSVGNAQEMAGLEPGETVQWQVGVRTDPATPGDIRIGLVGIGSPRLGLHITVRSCTRRWIGGICPAGANVVRAAGPVNVTGNEQELTTVPATEERWVLFDVWIEQSSSTPAVGETVTLRVHASGSGDEATVTPGKISTLATTGTDMLAPLAAAAASVLLGLALAGAAGIRVRRNR